MVYDNIALVENYAFRIVTHIMRRYFIQDDDPSGFREGLGHISSVENGNGVGIFKAVMVVYLVRQVYEKRF